MDTSRRAPAEGAFNEKQRDGVLPQAMTHLLHAAFGAEHFPHYLHRLAPTEIEALEAAAMALAAKDRAARLAFHKGC